MNWTLSRDVVESFLTNGVAIQRDFYDLERDIVPVQRQIHRLIGLVARRHGVELERRPFSPERFDDGYLTLLEKNRAYASEVYDGVKYLPAFHRLVAHPWNEAAMTELTGSSSIAIASAGFGIRIDNPREDRFRADWHQEYPAQLRSPTGVVFWSPLVAMTESLGPVRFCFGSQKDGLVPVHRNDPSRPECSGAYGFMLENRDVRVSRYPQGAPLTKPGDLVLIDFRTLHASGVNTSPRARWSMQFRYFDLEEPVGMKNGWPGSVRGGIDFASVHPELLAR